MAKEALSESRRYRSKMMPKIAAANQDLGHRMRLKGMEIEYRPDDDRLYVTFGEPHPSEAFSLDDGTHAVLLVNPETCEITGVEAPFFMEDFRKLENKPELWRLIVELIEKGGNYVYVPAADDADRAERALRSLVPSTT